MHKLISSGLWNEINRLAEKSKVKMAAVAYVTNDNSIKFEEGDLLIVDASNEAIESGRTSAPLLRRAFKKGAELYSCRGLHAKVMLFDGIALVGSANISQSSERSLVEAVLLTDNPNIVAMARNFIEKLRENSKLMDMSFINRINALKVERPIRKGFNPSKKRGLKIKINTPRTWLVSVTWLDEERYEEEITYAERGAEKAKELLSKSSSEVGWIRFTQAKSRFLREAKPFDSVIQIWSDSTKSKRPDAVYFHAHILSRQKEPTCTRFFFEDYANAERNALTWSQFKKLAKQVGVPFKVGRYTTRLLPDEYSSALASLWKEAKNR